MVQGENIGGVIKGAGIWQLRPPLGEVWLITYMKTYVASGTVYVYFTDGVVIEQTKLQIPLDNPNIRIFCDNNFWIEINSSNVNNAVTWSGVQFK